jgi:Flp pilus assembly CpaE family ATPase
VTTIGFLSAKHSPGTTIGALSIGIALTEFSRATLIELDPAGGDLAAYCRLNVERGLLSAVSMTRSEDDTNDFERHLQQHGGLNLMTAPMSPGQMRSVGIAATPAAIAASSKWSDVTLIDFGRLPTDDPNFIQQLAACDQIVLVLRPALADVEHVRTRLPSLRRITSPRLLVIGSTPYSPVEIATTLECDLLGALPFSPSEVELLCERPDEKATRRSALMRAARQCAITLQGLKQQPAAELVTAT